PGFLDHQMDIEKNRAVPAKRRDDVRAYRNIRDKMPVHDVDLDRFGPGLLDETDLFRQFTEVRGQDGRNDAALPHCSSCSSTMIPFSKMRARARPLTVTGTS